MSLPTMTLGQAELISWIARTGRNHKDIAQLLHVSGAYLSQILHGTRRPGLELATCISTATGVPIASWMARAESRTDTPEVRDWRRRPISGEN